MYINVVVVFVVVDAADVVVLLVISILVFVTIVCIDNALQSSTC